MQIDKWIVKGDTTIKKLESNLQPYDFKRTSLSTEPQLSLHIKFFPMNSIMHQNNFYVHLFFSNWEFLKVLWYKWPLCNGWTGRREWDAANGPEPGVEPRKAVFRTLYMMLLLYHWVMWHHPTHILRFFYLFFLLKTKSLMNDREKLNLLFLLAGFHCAALAPSYQTTMQERKCFQTLYKHADWKISGCGTSRTLSWNYCG